MHNCRYKSLSLFLLIVCLVAGGAWAADTGTPLHRAAEEGRADVIRAILLKGAAINAKNRDGSTALHLAVYRNNEECVRLLLDMGADVNTHDGLGRTPLHLAAENNNKELILLLLSQGAYPFEADNEGKMPFGGLPYGELTAPDASLEERPWRIKEGCAAPVTAICFSPGGRFLVSGSDDGRLAIWSPVSGRLLAGFSGHKASVTSVAFSPGGSRLASGSLDGTVILRDLSALFRDGSEKVLAHSSPVRSLCFSSEGKYLACGCTDGTVKVWSLASGEPVRSALLSHSPLTALALSPENRTLLAGCEDGTLTAIDFPGLESQELLYAHGSGIRSLCFSTRSRILASGDESGEILIGDIFSRRVLKRFQGHEGAVRSLLYSPGGRYLVSAGSDGAAKYWDGLSRSRSRVLYRGSVAIGAMKFSPGGRYLVLGGEDGSLSIVDSVFGALLTTLVAFSDGEWVSVTPGLYFDSSLYGARSILLESKGAAVTLDQYRGPRRSAGTVRDILGGRALPQKAQKLPDPPEIRIISPPEGMSEKEQITLKLEAKGKCRIRDLVVLINGRPAGTFAINESSAAEARELTAEIRLQPGLNRIEALAVSTDEVRSLPETVVIHYLYPFAVPSKKLFLLAVGISDYGDSNLNLECAARDAREIEAFFRRMKGLAFESVKSLALTDSQAKDHAILKALKEIGRESTERDLIVLFLAGHGVLDEQERFFFLCHGGRREGLPADGLVWGDFQKILMDLKAKHVLLIADVCHSASLFGADAGLAPHESLAEGMVGVTVFAACRADESSREFPRLGGVFTQTLLSGLGGKASPGGSGKVTLYEIEKYVTEMVPRITKDRQHPQVLGGTVDIPLSVYKTSR
ncbi:MAG: ankyrin repeat domain-containing protein [Candidatus Eremiobacteraeota bacterium]|nr:ankyrin repeat domain-containing protein [Candidatus Eremiobacteraeota bacterium]